jgi:hypothetical protein
MFELSMHEKQGLNEYNKKSRQRKKIKRKKNIIVIPGIEIFVVQVKLFII